MTKRVIDLGVTELSRLGAEAAWEAVRLSPMSADGSKSHPTSAKGLSTSRSGREKSNQRPSADQKSASTRA